MSDDDDAYDMVTMMAMEMIMKTSMPMKVLTRTMLSRSIQHGWIGRFLY